MRQRQPFGQVERRLQQNLRNVSDHLRTAALDHSPQHIVWRQFAVHRIETAQRQELLALECQRSPHVGIAAHQVQVEVWLECRFGRLTLMQPTFVAVQAGQRARQRNPLGHDQQGRRHQTITGTQQIEPASAFQLR
ncbi:hypothetical protein D3C81_805360 [compost metagenome]